MSADGQLYTWGEDIFGALGHGDTSQQIAPKLVEALQGVEMVSVVAARLSSAAVSKLGAVYSWGPGMKGLLGHGDEENKLVPKEVEGLRVRGV